MSPKRSRAFTWSNGGATMTFNPAADFANGTVVNFQVNMAANDAAVVSGVKTVVNNLQVSAPQVAQEAAPPPEPGGAGVRGPLRPCRRRSHAGARHRHPREEQGVGGRRGADRRVPGGGRRAVRRGLVSRPRVGAQTLSLRYV